MKVNHSLEVLSSLKQSINDSTINDVQILVGKEKKVFYASSFFLASRSPIFKSMFFTSETKDQEKMLELPELNPNNFLFFLEYINCGEVELTGQNIFDILELSDKYRFEKLYLECQEYLNKGIDSQNCLGMLENGIRLSLEGTIKECWDIIDKETEKILNNENNLSISTDTLELLLSRNSLHVKEIDLFRFLIKWGKNQEQQRNSSLNNSKSSWKEIVKPYLHHIRFPLMNFKELIREVRPLGVIDDSQYIEALEFNGDKEFFTLEENNKPQFQERKEKKKELQNGYKKEIRSGEESFVSRFNYSLSDNNRIVTKTSSDGWNCTCIGNLLVNRGIHRWSLKILRSTQFSNFMIGIAPHNISQSDTSNYKKCGWYLYCWNGNLYSGPPTNYNSKVYYGSKIPEGSIIDVELDISKCTIRYFLNGEDKGLAYEGIPANQFLRLAIEIWNQGDSIKLLSYSQK